MTLKNHLSATATACALVMSIVIAQDQAPAPARPPAPPARQPNEARADAPAPRDKLINEMREKGIPEDKIRIVQDKLAAADDEQAAAAQPPAAAEVAAPPPAEAEAAAPEAAAADPEAAIPAQPPAVAPRGPTTRPTLNPRGVGATANPRAAGQPAATPGANGAGAPGTGLNGLGAVPGGAAAAAAAGAASGKASGSSSKTNAPTLKFAEAPLDIVLGTYAEVTGRAPIIAPNVPKVSITFNGPPKAEYDKDDFIFVIEELLSLHDIALEPYSNKFVYVYSKKDIRSEGIETRFTMPGLDKLYAETGKTISQLIQLKNISAAEAQKALEGFKTPSGLFQVFERMNAVLVTDTQRNINRMLELVETLDVSIPVTEEVFFHVVRYAKAEDIKKRLEEFVAESQKQVQAKEEVKIAPSGAPVPIRTTTPTPTVPGRPGLPPGLVRPGQPVTPTPPTPTDPMFAGISDADRGMIRGKVHIMADERTNMLIITTHEKNMDFFNKIIDKLDIETTPDVGVEVQRLKYADSEEVATKLNDLIGNTTARQDSRTTPTAPGAAGRLTGQSTTTTPDTPQAAPRPDLAALRSAAANAVGGETKLGQLNKENIKILSDKRTNAIIMMGSRSDLTAIKKIIDCMDIQLAQVLIETVVVQVELGNGITAGIDWVLGKTANGYTIRHDQDKMAGGGGSGTSLLGNLTAITGGSSGSGGGSNETLTAASHVLSQGINYFLKSDKMNISALIQAAANDSRAKVLSSPILLTVDNKEASIEATSMRYLYKGVRYSGGYGGYGNNGYNSGYEVPDFEQRDIGLTMKITPRINPNGTVVLTVDEKFETIGPDQDVGGQKYPTVTTRKVQADVSVENQQTIVLGGLVQKESKKANAGIPILKDIPWIGRWLFGSVVDSEYRSELLIFLTPYVFEDSASAMAEAKRRKETLSTARPWDDAGWSGSDLADPVSPKTILDRQTRSWADDDQEYKTKREIDRAHQERAKMMLERTKKEAEEAAKRQNKKLPKTADIPGRMWDFRVGGEDVKLIMPRGETQLVEPEEGGD